MTKYIALLVVLVILTGCDTRDTRNADFKILDAFSEGEEIANIPTTYLEEISGIDLSDKYPNHLWGHNDSGDVPRLLLMGIKGGIRATILLQGIESIDWEDITVANGKIYIADIGDNKAQRETISIHQIDEPELTGDTIQVKAEAIHTMTFSYAEGPRDAETLMFDYSNDELVIVTKREANCKVYSFPFLPSDKIQRIISRGTLPLNEFTAGDISTDGQILLKNYDAIFYWGASTESAASRILKTPEFRVPYIPEPQGEAICWGSSKGFYTASEYNKHARQILYYYQLIEK